MASGFKKAVLAGGCFWGMEELFRKLPGVMDTEAVYVGGEPHAEALEIEYDPAQISYRQLLDFFFQIHDPTTLNKQGNDVGLGYRSAIFYADEDECAEAEKFIELVNQSGRWHEPVVTTLEPLGKVWPAEDFHQDFLQKNPGGYTCHYLRPGGSYL